MESTPAHEIAATTPRGTPLAVLRSSNFLKLFVAGNLSLFGDFFSYVALAWLVLQVTGSSLALAGVLVAQAVPRSVLIAVGGAAADRLSARVTMAGSMALRVAVVGPLAALTLTGHVQMWEVYIASAVFGVVDAFFLPARSSVLPTLVKDRELEPANAVLNVSSQIAIVAGPVLAGVVVAAFGTGWAFAADAACFAVGVPIVLLLPRALREGVNKPKGGGLGGDIVAGLRYAWSDIGIRVTLVIVAVVDFGAQGAIGVGLPTLAHGRFEAGASGFGFLLAGWGLGATLGAAAAGVVPPPRRFGIAAAVACGWIGLCIVALGLMPALVPAIGVIAAAGLASGSINTYGMSWLQRRTDPSMQGRVMSLIMLASVGLTPVGTAVAGVLGQVNPTLLFAAAGTLIVTAAVAAMSSRAVRSI
jgi:MFS family permease